MLKLYFSQEKLVADIILPVLFFIFILFFCIKYLNFYFNVQEKPPIGEPFGQRNAAVETEPFPGYWIRIQAGICGFYRKKKTNKKKTQRA